MALVALPSSVRAADPAQDAAAYVGNRALAPAQFGQSWVEETDRHGVLGFVFGPVAGAANVVAHSVDDLTHEPHFGDTRPIVQF